MIQPIVWKELSNNEKKKILMRPVFAMKDEIVAQVKSIINEVREDKDAACIKMTKAFDGVDISDLTVSDEELDIARKEVSQRAIDAMKKIIENLYAFHVPQKLNDYKVETSPGIICENQIRPLQRIGIYVPSGTAPLVSTVFMIGVPSQIAGCPTRVLCSPPDTNGRINPNILVAAKLCGIHKIYKLGGAQAIAAMAYGTQTIPKVDKIFGPGNAYVTEAKIQVSLNAEGAQYEIPAGPSEVMVIADSDANPEFVAADLLSQAEHGTDSQVMLISIDKTLANKVSEQIEFQLSYLRRREIAAQSLKNSRFIIVDTVFEAIDIANDYAPEHLILQINAPRYYVDKIVCAGSVFLGPYSPEPVGDYASGTNHVLPTYGHAKSLSGLSVRDFIRTISVQELSREGLQSIAETIREMTTIERLDAHQKAVDIRLGEVINEQ
jgi:histidinol dehydrogenase